MNKHIRHLVAVAAVSALLQTAPASAVPVNYNGALFDVLVTGVSGTTYSFRYTADFTSAQWLTYRAANNTTYIDAVGFGIAGYEVFGTPTVTTIAPGTWTAGTGTINSSGCALAANGQGPCGNVNPVTSAPTLGSYYWDFTAELYKTGSCDDKANTPKPACSGQIVEDGAFLQTGNPIRADFYTNGVMSLAGPFTDCRDGKCEPSRDVPEPGSLALLGLGLLSLGFQQRKSRQADFRARSIATA